MSLRIPSMPVDDHAQSVEWIIAVTGRRPLTQMAADDALNRLDVRGQNMPATAAVEPNTVMRMKSRNTQDESRAVNIVNHRRLMRQVNLMPQSFQMNIDEIGL